MAGVHQMAGTPWHVERFARKEGDDRRHRARCVFYIKKDNYCRKRYGVCKGSAHCSFYKESDVDNTDQEGNDSSSEKNPIPEFSKVFAGVKEIPLDQIKVYTLHGHPRDDVQKIIDHFHENGTFRSPVVVTYHEEDGLYWLEDKYLTYFVAQKLNLKTVPAKIQKGISKTKGKEIFPVRSTVYHPVFGEGQVKNIGSNLIKVQFSDGETRKFALDICIEKNLLRAVDSNGYTNNDMDMHKFGESKNNNFAR